MKGTQALGALMALCCLVSGIGMAFSPFNKCCSESPLGHDNQKYLLSVCRGMGGPCPNPGGLHWMAR